MQFNQLKRREFITLLGGAAAWPLAAPAQQTDRTRRIAVLVPFAESDPDTNADLGVFRAELAQRGWTESRNLQIDYRWAAGDVSRIKRFAAELVELKPDAIVGRSTPVTAALLQATR